MQRLVSPPPLPQARQGMELRGERYCSKRRVPESYKVPSCAELASSSVLEKPGMFGVQALWKAQVTNNNLAEKKETQRGGGTHMRKVLPHPGKEAFSSIGDVLLILL